MNLYTLAARARKSRWNLDDIEFLYQPDNFVGSFSNARMQARHEAMQQEKVDALLAALSDEVDPPKAMRVLHRLDQLIFFTHNRQAFEEHGSFETTLLELYSRVNTPFSAGGDYLFWLELFRQADPVRMAAAGSPFPEGRSTVYRGSVIGSRKGFSWTPSRKETTWILERWRNKEEGGGTVYALEIGPAEVLVYLRQGRRDEVILRPEVAVKEPGREVEELQ